MLGPSTSAFTGPYPVSGGVSVLFLLADGFVGLLKQIQRRTSVLGYPFKKKKKHYGKKYRRFLTSVISLYFLVKLKFQGS